jgi:hypothetical protein
MVRPSNGLYYDTFIYGKYFTTTYEGAVAADDTTLSAIAAINRLLEITNAGGTIKLEHEHLVVAARAAYDKIATKEQQALVTNYAALQSAEDRINALKDTSGGDDTVEPPVDSKDNGRVALIVTVIVESVLIVGAIAAAVVWYLLKKRKTTEDVPMDEANEPASEEVIPKNEQEPAAQDENNDAE